MSISGDQCQSMAINSKRSNRVLHRCGAVPFDFTKRPGTAGIEVRRWRSRGARRQAHVFLYRLRQQEWPDQTSDQAFGLLEVLVAVSTSRLSCKRAGKTRTLMPVWDS